MTALPILRGPADPDQFRIKVGRFKERWYHDPLPGCDIAPATDESWPSATTVKGAWPKFLHYWSAGEAAKCAVKETANWKGMTEAAAIEYIAKAHTRTRDAAGDRGSLAHEVVVDLIEGRPIDAMVEAQISPWLATLRQFVTDCQPRILYSEVVTISRGLKIGGTIDAGLEFPSNGKRYWVDWKTREVGKHDPYDDDAAQLGLYTQPDAYLIVTEDGRAKRIPLPQLDGAIIVTVAPDGYRIHPVDLDIAHDVARSLRAFWDTTRTTAVGKPIVLGSGNGTTPPTNETVAAPDDGGLRAEHARQRLIVLADRNAAVTWPSGVQTFKEVRLSKHAYTHHELLAIEAALSEAEKTIEAPFPPDEPACDPERLAVMVARLEKIPSDLFAKAVEASQKHLIPNLRTGKVSVRHLQLLEEIVGPLEVEAGQRTGAARSLLGEYGDDPNLGRTILALAGCTDLAAVDDSTAVWVTAIVEALDDDILTVSIADDATETLASTPKAEALLLDLGGEDRSRAKAVNAIKDIADTHGLKRPRSFAVAAADPLLCALAAHAARQPA